MTKITKLFALLLYLWSGCLNAQTIVVIIDPNPSPFISDWENKKSGSVILQNDYSAEVCKIKAEVYDSKGSLVAYNNLAQMPDLSIEPGITQYSIEDIFPLSAVNYRGNLEKTTLKTGRIPDDNYKFCVTLVDAKTFAPVGTSGTVCKMFNIVAYQAPTLIAPSENEEIPVSGVKGIVFRWTPVTPSPKTLVTYRLQVFEVMSGQSNITALRSNQPFIEKDLKGMLQTQWPIEFAMPETGKKYIWTVTPLDEEERKLVDGNGFAQPQVFSIILSKNKINPNLNDSIIGLVDSIPNSPIMDVPCRSYCTTTSWTDSRGCVHTTLVCTSICPSGVSQDWYHGRACDGNSTNKLRNDSCNKENFSTLLKPDKKEIAYRGKEKVVKEMIRIYIEIYDALIKNKILSDKQKDSIMGVATDRINRINSGNFEILDEVICSNKLNSLDNPVEVGEVTMDIGLDEEQPMWVIPYSMTYKAYKENVFIKPSKDSKPKVIKFVVRLSKSSFFIKGQSVKKNIKMGVYVFGVETKINNKTNFNQFIVEVKDSTRDYNLTSGQELIFSQSISNIEDGRLINTDIPRKVKVEVKVYLILVNNYGINDEGIKKTIANSENVPGALITAEIWNEVQNTYTVVEAKKTDHLGTYHFRNMKSGKYRLTVVLPGTLEDWTKKSETAKPQTLYVNFQIQVNSFVPILRGSKSGNNPLRFVSPDFSVEEKLNSIAGKVFTSANNYGINDEGIK